MRELLNNVKKLCPLAWEKLDEIEKKACDKIAFEHLWLLYLPGKTVFSKDAGQWGAYKVYRAEIPCGSSSDMMLVHCCFLDFDKTGKWLVPQPKVFRVPLYPSERPIRDLDIIPDWCYPDLGEKLIQRGKKFSAFRKEVSYKQYCGDEWPKASEEVNNNPKTLHIPFSPILTTYLGCRQCHS